MSVVVIVAVTSALEFPCLVFETEEKAQEYLKDVFFKYAGIYSGGMCGIEKGEFIYVPAHALADGMVIGTTKEQDRHFEEHWKNFFTYYYDGCGGVNYFKVATIEYGKPSIGFSLD